MPSWNRIDDDRAGYAYSLSDAMSLLDLQYPGFLHPPTDNRLVIASDYSGQHRRASHEAYSFLMTTEPEINRWNVDRCQVRVQWLPDGRRMSFKDLGDGMKWRALIPFLDAAFRMRGHLVTVLVDKRIGSFIGGISEDALSLFPDCFPPKTKVGTVEKMIRLATLISMLIVGLRSEDQPAWWVSDHDETLDTDEKREGIARLMAYLSYGFSKWQRPAECLFGTTGNPVSPEWSEDLCAIPDLFAGAFSAMSGSLPRHFDGKDSSVQVVSSKNHEHHRARTIGNWVGSQLRPLRHILLRLEYIDSRGVIASYQIIRGLLASSKD